MELANVPISLSSHLEAIDRHPLTVTPETSFIDAIALMSQARNRDRRLTNSQPILNSSTKTKPSSGCVLVLDGNLLVGMLSEGDVVNIIATKSRWQETKVADVINPNFITLKDSEFTDIFTAIDLFIQHSIDQLPIIDEEGKLVGLITEKSLSLKIYYQAQQSQPEVVQHWEKSCECLENKSEVDRQFPETALEQINADLEQQVQQHNENYEMAVLAGYLVAEQLRNSEAELRALFDTMIDIVLVLDAEGRYIKIAPSAPQLLYKPSEEMLGKTVTEVLPAAAAKLCLSYIERTLITQQTETIDYTLEIGGKLIWFEANISPFGYDRVILVARDITQRQLTEVALQKSEDKFRNLFDDAPIALSLVSVRDFRMVKVNDAHRQMFGYTDEELVAMSFADVTHPEDLEADLELVKQLIDGDIPRFQMEKRCTKKNGELMWVKLTVTLIRDVDGSPLYTMGAIEDISDSKGSQLQLQQLKERLQFLLASNPAVIFTVSPEGNFDTTYISDNVSSLVGYNQAEFLVDTGFWVSHIHPEDIRLFLVTLSDLSVHKNSSCEYRFLHKDGIYRWLRTELKLLVDYREKPIEIIGYAADISNSKYAEIALRQQFEQEQLVEAIARRVRQSLQLEEILNTTVAELQQVVLADRVLVYQILPDACGKVIAEAVADGCSPLMNRVFSEQIFRSDNYPTYLCGVFGDLSEQKGRGIAHDLVDFMKEIEVRAKLVVPIFQVNQLWGLLIAQQCERPREWQEWEINLFQQLVNQLAIAIQQSLLYQQLQAELSDRKQAEDRLKKSLKEKEILLKEIHHRVKNNLCVVASLLELQSDIVGERQLAKIFEESQHRLYSMALIHEKLYRSKNLAQINFGEYLEDLVTNLFNFYNISDHPIQLQVLAEPILLNIETATPCGLIANELVSNSLKHAFPDRANGTVSVECYQTGDREIHLIVKDNGKGFPKNFNFRKTNSMGFQVVCTLTEQLEANIELSGEIGSTFHLKFNEAKYFKRI